MSLVRCFLRENFSEEKQCLENEDNYLKYLKNTEFKKAYDIVTQFDNFLLVLANTRGSSREYLFYFCYYRGKHDIITFKKDNYNNIDWNIYPSFSFNSKKEFDESLPIAENAFAIIEKLECIDISKLPEMIID